LFGRITRKPSTQCGMWFLARLNADNANFGHARTRFEHAQSAMKRVLGPQNLWNLFASIECANFLRDTGRRKEAALIIKINLSELENLLRARIL
jgi:hypothetical protein